ncbi:phosphomevalonate kinase [Eupransor demetentiae]|uniref:Mevalonate kinase (ERG12) n=1 Tax=Eupransor demetentiae TaxID=3109584 RepID=A0ABM9N4M2_9LACO|nr:Mevalonate kinase (ERG12) [Lactobacillaceae bacterium LMG 33000]
MNKLEIDIPGKLFLAGEYAVTKAGNQALLAAVQKGLKLSLIPKEGDQSRIKSGKLPDLIFDFQQEITVETTSPWSYVHSALKTLQSYIGQGSYPSFDLKIESQMVSPQGKLGLGSSAAVSVAIIKALNQFWQLKLPVLTQYKLAAIAHYRIQGSGSLGDVAAITYGGIIHYHSPAIAELEEKRLSVPDLIQMDWPDLSIKPLHWPANWQLILAATHQPADTKTALAGLILPASFYQKSNHCVEAASLAFQNQDYDKARQALTANQELLIAALPAPYLSERLASFWETIQGQHLAGKVSGAGFGDNGYYLTRSQEKVDSQLKICGLTCTQLPIAPATNL